jgi:hypothetical protein
MEAQQDFRDLLASFNAHGVDYLVVGAHALAYHGVPRYTGDLDVLVRPETTNARRILDALSEFGFTSPDLTIEDFNRPGKVVQLGIPPVRIDIVTSITGVTWDEAERGRVIGTYGDVNAPFLGKKEFVRNKQALGRKKDLADIEALGAEDESMG